MTNKHINLLGRQNTAHTLSRLITTVYQKSLQPGEAQLRT